MENKYYKPNKEDFHIGLPYQYKSSLTYGYLDNTNGEWVDMVFSASAGPENENSEFEDIEKALEGDTRIEVRCKLLDRQDIEELGWKESGGAFFIGCIELNLPDDTTEFYHIYDNCKHSDSTLFIGTIRNKSQLRQLMSWLNIE